MVFKLIFSKIKHYKNNIIKNIKYFYNIEMTDILKKNICELWNSIQNINNRIHSIIREGIGSEKKPIEHIFSKKIFANEMIIGAENELSFLDIIKKELSFSLKQDTEQKSISDEFEFNYENSLENKIIFFMRYNEPSIFINLITSVLFRLVFPDNREINFQGANSAVRYFSVNIFPITKIYKNVPYYTYPTNDYWTIIQINTNGNWVDNVKFFSFTPYIGQYTKDGKTTDYLANCNTSITSTLIKADHPEIFTKKRDTIKILYTFNSFFAKIFNNPEKKQYAILLPNMIDSSTFTIMTRFEKTKSLNTINFSKSIRALLSSQRVTYNCPLRL